METESHGSSEQYAAVVNDEEQYSIWPADRPLPRGWRLTGTTGSREDCLAHIGKVWKDMRPASLRSDPARAR